MTKPTGPELLDPETVRQVKWQHAVNPSPVRPIATYEQREALYRKQIRDFHLRECSWMLALFASICFGLTFIFTKMFAYGAEPLDLDWRLPGLIMTIATMIPAYLTMKPARRQPGDVEEDRALRRAVGMGDTLAE
jgi:hypothetical protein